MKRVEKGYPFLGHRSHNALADMASVVMEEGKEVAVSVHIATGEPLVPIERVDEGFVEMHLIGHDVEDRVDPGRYLEVGMGYLDRLPENANEIHVAALPSRKASHTLLRTSPTRNSAPCPAS